ncbi:MAG: tetratricopeptide (TPR) repeat protein [Crocinitomicaceae bacterium]|jgi:tetratricopeptide (TPR) repeat protein
MRFWINILLILLFTGNFAYSQDEEDKYVNPDVTSVYSTHPERPFRYGFPYERSEILSTFEDRFIAYGIKSGDVVAEIGAASGWLQGVFSVLSDSVTYYIQDIDTNVLNKKQFDAVIEHFSAQRITPQTNNFHFVLGTETGSNLEVATFDLIIINNTFHEFTEVGPMMDDIITKLKPGGRLVISEAFANPDLKVRHGGCEKKAYTVATVEELLQSSGLYLTKMEFPEYSTKNFLTFEANKEKADEYHDWLNKIDPILADLNALNSKKVHKKFSKLSQVQNDLDESIYEILEHFPSLKPYFFNLADEFLEAYKYDYAIQVMETCVELFPNDSESYSVLADTYYESRDYETAMDYYKIVMDLDPTDMYARGSAIMSATENYLFDEAFTQYQQALMVDSTDDFLHSTAGDLFQAIIDNVSFPFTVEMLTGEDSYTVKLDYEDLLEAAVDSYSKAITINPLIPDYYITRGRTQMDLGNYEEALEDYNYAIYLNPYEYWFYSMRAQAKLYLENEEGYEEDLILSKSIRKKK